MTDDTSFNFLSLGAIIQRFQIQGINIVQGFPTADLYRHHNAPFFGETIGRVANRISSAKLENINGQNAYYPLIANDGAHALHGGVLGWGKKMWTGPMPAGLRTKIPGLDGPLTSGGETIRFTLISPDGDEGYPGTVRAAVNYTAGQQVVSDNNPELATVLVVDYEAQLVEGADETVINMTNHTYFNLTGSTNIDGTVVKLATNKYLSVDDEGIPTGSIATFPGIPQAKPFALGPKDPDVDHCFIINDMPTTVPIDTRSLPLVRLLTAHHPESGIHLEVYSTEPAFQFYTGRFVNVPAIAEVPARGPRCAFCVEPSRYVNAPNVDEWRNMVLLKKGETYGSRIVYRAWKEAM